MTSREARLYEALSREKKAARIALAFVRGTTLLAGQDLDRKGLIGLAETTEAITEVARALGYGYVSPDTRERVIELVKELPKGVG